MHKRWTRRLVVPVLAGLATSAAVAAIGLASQSGGQAAAAGPPANATGQAAGQLVIDGKTMPILSYSVGASNPAFVGGGGGGGAGKVSFSSLSMMKAVDVNSPMLLSAVASGKRFPTAVFTAQWGVGGAAATIAYELSDVNVESVQHSGGGSAATESLSLAFGKIKWTYTDASGTDTGSWDIVNNNP